MTWRERRKMLVELQRTSVAALLATEQSIFDSAYNLIHPRYGKLGIKTWDPLGESAKLDIVGQDGWVCRAGALFRRVNAVAKGYRWAAYREAQLLPIGGWKHEGNGWVYPHPFFIQLAVRKPSGNTPDEYFLFVDGHQTCHADRLLRWITGKWTPRQIAKTVRELMATEDWTETEEHGVTVYWTTWRGDRIKVYELAGQGYCYNKLVVGGRLISNDEKALYEHAKAMATRSM